MVTYGLQCVHTDPSNAKQSSGSVKAFSTHWQSMARCLLPTQLKPFVNGARPRANRLSLQVQHEIDATPSSEADTASCAVIIVSYEKLRMLQDELGTAEIGLLLADEGHRLKNSENQTYTALNQINCKRRVILTGTPIQVSDHEVPRVFWF